MTFIGKERVYNLQEMYKHTKYIFWTLCVHEKAVLTTIERTTTKCEIVRDRSNTFVHCNTRIEFVS